LLLLFSPRWLFLYPGLAFLLAGIFLTAALYFAPLRIAGAGLDVATSVQWVSHTNEVLGKLEAVLSSLTDAETAQRGYLYMSPRFACAVASFWAAALAYQRTASVALAGTPSP